MLCARHVRASQTQADQVKQTRAPGRDTQGARRGSDEQINIQKSPARQAMPSRTQRPTEAFVVDPSSPRGLHGTRSFVFGPGRLMPQVHVTPKVQQAWATCSFFVSSRVVKNRSGETPITPWRNNSGRSINQRYLSHFGQFQTYARVPVD